MIGLHPAEVQDRDSAPEMILELLAKTPTVEKLFADSAYAGPKQAGRLRGLGVPELLDQTQG